MASLARPTKRQRRDHNGVDTSTNPMVPKAISCLGSATFSQQVERLCETSIICSDDLIEVLGQIKSNADFMECNGIKEKSTLRKLHRTLILYIGFLMGSLKEAKHINKKSRSLLSSLLHCLRDLYASRNGTLQEFITIEEFSELFVLVPKVICSTSSELDGEEGLSNATIRRAIKKSCFEILQSWLKAPDLLKPVITKSTIVAFENFILGILKSNGANADKTVFNQILEQLQSLCSNNSEFRQLLDIAQLVRGSHVASSLDDLSPRLTIFYWRCVSSVQYDIDLETANHAIDSLLPYGTSNNILLLRQAMSCMSEFIEASSQERQIQLIRFTSKKLLERDMNRKDTNLSLVLNCLGQCMKRASVIDLFLRQKSWEKAFDILVSLVEDEEDTNIAEKAAMVAIPILKTLMTSDEHRSPMLLEQALEVSLCFISLRHASIVGSTIEFLFTALQDFEIRRLVESSTLLPDLVNTLGDLSSKNFFVETKKKEQLAQIFCMLIEKLRNVNFLARTASNLAFLVRLANGSFCETDQSLVQEISICTIMKLAKNPCNQRVLAKEPGLLSTLIRYTRMTPENTTAALNERSISRKEMKDRILLVANAL